MHCLCLTKCLWLLAIHLRLVYDIAELNIIDVIVMQLLFSIFDAKIGRISSFIDESYFYDVQLGDLASIPSC